MDCCSENNTCIAEVKNKLQASDTSHAGVDRLLLKSVATQYAKGKMIEMDMNCEMRGVAIGTPPESLNRESGLKREQGNMRQQDVLQV